MKNQCVIIDQHKTKVRTIFCQNSFPNQKPSFFETRFWKR